MFLALIRKKGNLLIKFEEMSDVYWTEVRVGIIFVIGTIYLRIFLIGVELAWRAVIMQGPYPCF